MCSDLINVSQGGAVLLLMPVRGATLLMIGLSLAAVAQTFDAVSIHPSSSGKKEVPSWDSAAQETA
jgi:hypothetical protein